MPAAVSGRPIHRHASHNHLVPNRPAPIGGSGRHGNVTR